MLSLYQLIFNFLIKIISFVIDSELDSNQLRRLGLVVKNLQSNKRFTFDFFTELERDKDKKKIVKKKKKYTVNKAKVVKTEEEIIQVRPHSPEMDKISVISVADMDSSELKFTLDVGSEENNFIDNWFIRKYECIFDWKIMKFFRVLDGRHILCPEISFILNESYEKSVFIVFLLYMKYGINREIYSYDGSTMLFSIKNNLIKISKFIKNELEFHKIDLTGYHFSVISKFDRLYPSIEELEESGTSITQLLINNYDGFICRCMESEEPCISCVSAYKILNLVQERLKTCSCASETCGWCLETVKIEKVLELAKYNYQCINSSKISTLCHSNPYEIVKLVREYNKEIYVKHKKYEEPKSLVDKPSSYSMNIGLNMVNNNMSGIGSLAPANVSNVLSFDRNSVQQNVKKKDQSFMLKLT